MISIRTEKETLVASPHVFVRTGKKARRYWTKEQTERIVREGSARDIAENLPESVQAGLLTSRSREAAEIVKKHFVKLETDAIRMAQGLPEPTDRTAEETHRMVEEARRRLRRS